MNGTLYRIFNIKNGKSYIGKTYSSIYTRLRNHIKDSKKFSSRPLYRAFNKWGLDSFSLEILGEFPEGVLEEEEIKAIEQFNSYGSHGYNATMGGDGKKYLNLDDSYILSLYNESKNITEVSSKVGCNIKAIRAILNSYNIDIYDGSSRKVIISNLNLEFDSITECADYLIECGITKNKYARNKIYDVLTGSRKSYLGFTFCYGD